MASRRNPKKPKTNPPETTNEEESNEAPRNRRQPNVDSSVPPRETSGPLTIREPLIPPSIPESSKPLIRDPSIPASIPTTAREPPLVVVDPNSGKCKNCAQNFMTFIYNSKEGTFCERTCRSWIEVIGYSLLYLIFLTTYTLVFLYASLCIIKAKGFSVIETEHSSIERLMSHESKGEVGLSATPTAVQDKDGNPIIWYRSNHSSDYGKYISALDSLLLSRRSTPELIKSLGPCGKSPYGYGDKPCVVVRINKQLNWVGIPLSANTTLKAPAEVMTWVKSGKRMLWLHCVGHHPYDQEHIGKISYYPHPPGFDPKEFPLDVNKSSPLVAVQFSNFTRGISISVTCKLWHEYGPSSVNFLLYVLAHKKSKDGARA